MAKRGNSGKPSDKPKQKPAPPRTLTVRFVDAGTTGPISEHLVEWFDGKNKIATTKTDNLGRTFLPGTVRVAAKDELEARVLRPHADPSLPPILIASAKAAIPGEKDRPELSIEIPSGNPETVRRAGEPEDRAEKRNRITKSLGLFGESLKKRIGNNDVDAMMSGYRAGRAMIANIGTQLHEYSREQLPPGIRDFLESLRDRQKCTCDACESAVSPLAYLAHLLDFTTRHVANASPPRAVVTIAQLEQHFGQRFSTLTQSCKASETQVAQALLAIEVLENHFVRFPLTAQQRTALEKERASRLLDAYLVLLQRIGISYDEVRLADTTERKAALAALVGIEAQRVDSLNLDPSAAAAAPNALNAARLAKLFGLASGQGTSAADPPDIVTWRYESLTKRWEEEDQPTTDELAGGPVIDTDVMGPDDFRNPAAKTNPAAADGPFDIWLRRREWLDSAQSTLGGLADLEARLVRMYQPFPYPGQNITPWLPATPVGDFVTISQELLAGARVDANSTRLETDLRISTDAFNRLMALRRKDALARAIPPRGESLSNDEGAEVLAILLGSLKRRAFVRWLAEERAATIAVDPRFFWVPRRSPTAGEWPRARGASEPYLDPAAASQADLPEGAYGSTARNLLQSRTTQLTNRRNALATERETLGFEECLELGLDWWAVPAGSTALAEFRTLAQEFSTPATTAAARVRIDTELFMSGEDFAQVVQVDQREQAGERLAAGDYEALYQALVSAFRRQQNPIWRGQEAGIPYWQLLKQRLVAWRASTDDRSRWQRALRAASRPVVVDPDLLYSSDFVLNQRAYTLWLSRSTEVSTHIASLRTQTATARATPPTAAERTALDTLLTSELQISPQGLLDLTDAADRGEEVEWRVEQLMLDGESLSELTRIIRLAGTAAGTKRLLDSEWEAVFAICTQVWKRRERALTWHVEDRTNTNAVRPITLSPDFFRILTPSSDVFPVPALPALKPWLASPFARLDWVDKLQSRIDQKINVGDAWRTTIRGAEEIILPGIRDVLLQAANPTARPLIEVAKELEREYLIDFRMGGCAIATRVSQAIETVQGFLEGLRTSQSILIEKFQLSTTASFDFAAFDEDLRWLGSYAAWRSAMFVFLFPEVLLSPSLRDHQTSGFMQLLESLRSTPRLTPDLACQFAGDYADYFNDVTGLALGACVRANVRNKETSCQNRGLPPLKEVEFLVALAPSGKVYSSMRDTGPTATLSYAQTPWMVIEKPIGVVAILGATAYESPSTAGTTKRSVAVLLKVAESGVMKLRILTFDLDTADWSDADLDLPDGMADFDATFITAAAGSAPSDRPQVEIAPLPTGRAQYRSLNRSLNGWDGQNFLLREVSVEIHLLEPGEVEWVPDEMSHRNAENINRVSEWAKTRGFLAATPTFRTVGGKQEVIAFDSKAVVEEDFHSHVLAKDNEYWWSSLQWVHGYLSDSDTEALDKEDRDTIAWLQVATTAAKSLTGPGYLGAFPRFELDIDTDTALDVTPRPFHVYAFKPSEFVTKQSVVHQSLNANFFTNTGVLESKLAGFQRAVHEYAVSQGFAAGIPTWWGTLNGNTSGDDVVDDNIAANYLHEYIAFKRGDGLTRKTAMCGNLTKWKPLYPAGEARFAYYHKPTARDLSAWVTLIAKIYNANNGQTAENLNYADEASYFVPMMLAIRLHQSGEYDAALEWFRLALDWTLGAEQGIQRSRFLDRHARVTTSWNVTDDWLRDPLHPHLIAATRPRAYARFTLFAIIRCHLDYADSEYTAENTAKAKRLYQKALDLLLAQVFQVVDPCAPKKNEPQLDPDVLNQIDDKFKPGLNNFFNEITPLEEAIRNRFIKKLEGIIKDDNLGPGLPKLWKEIEAARDKLPGPMTLGDAMAGKDKLVRGLAATLSSHEDFRQQLDLAIDSALIRQAAIFSRPGDVRTDGNDPRGVPRMGGGGGAPGMEMAVFAATAEFRIGDTAPGLSDVYGVGAGYGLLSGALNPFCIPVNPLMRTLRLHAEVNIHKIENCRNISGMKRTSDLYGAPTDTSSGMPSIGAGGQLVLPGLARLAPTQYRFRFLIERARQLVQLAQQTESAMFSVLMQRDGAAYSLFKARQDVRLGRSELTLQDLRLKETKDESALAGIQQERAQFQVAHFTALLNADLNGSEIASLVMTVIAAAHSATVSGIYFGTWRYAEGVSAAGQAWSQKASIAATLAQYERRREEWRFQRTLARFDLSAANMQTTIAQDRVRIATQERAVTELRNEMAEDTVEFLTNRQFATEELLEWMSEILESTYRSMLQQATSVARLATAQLAFERQERPPDLIKLDYWVFRDDFQGSLGEATDRKGLTGSTRLLNDIELLNQHAIDTDKRKLHLTKMISLAQLAPLEFEEFRATGVLTVGTPMSLFDQDFPGQYLRLVKRVRVSLIALIPPTAGIKATLTASAASRVVVGGDLFQTIRVQHGPDMVALTSTQNATGVFDFDVQPEMLAPFEGIGVDTIWELKLPKASNLFDYSTIADVILTLDYSALFDYDYEQTVISELRQSFEADRGFSLRHDFPDAWYDLLNPELTSTPMVVRFRTTYEDFPANLERLIIRNVALAFLRKENKVFEIQIAGLQFTPDGNEVNYGGAAMTLEGIASTRRGNAQNWLSMIGRSPCGIWELALPNTADLRSRFSSGAIDNVVLMVSYSGRRPVWR